MILGTGRSSNDHQYIHIYSRRRPDFCRDYQGRQGCTLIKDRSVREAVQKYPPMSLTLTWCHHAPPDTPTRFPTSAGDKLDNVACTPDDGRWVGAIAIAIATLPSNTSPGTTALIHQG